MAEQTKISWTNHTWNPWQGCTRVSQGCAHCYMVRQQTRYGLDSMNVRRSSEPTFRRPSTWNRKAARDSSFGTMVFVCSWSDFFHVEADPWRAEAWELMRSCENLIFQIPTKRPERIKDCLPADWGCDGYANVWLGVSVESADYLHRVDQLRAVSAAIRFVSYEPALGPIADAIDLNGIHWLIYGGESGSNYRPDNDQWCRDVRDRCRAEGVAFYRKQGNGLHSGMRVELDGEIVREFPEFSFAK